MGSGDDKRKMSKEKEEKKLHPIRSKEHAGSAKQDKHPRQFAPPRGKEKKKEKKKKHAGNPRCKMEHPLSQKLVRAKRKEQWKSQRNTDEQGYLMNAACRSTPADIFIKLTR